MGEVGIPAIKLSPASLQHLPLGERDGMQARESGRLGVLDIFWEKISDVGIEIKKNNRAMGNEKEIGCSREGKVGKKENFASSGMKLKLGRNEVRMDRWIYTDEMAVFRCG